MLKVTKQPITIKYPKTIQPNYYLSIASVDSNMTINLYIPVTLNKHINTCVENTSKNKINS